MFDSKYRIVFDLDETVVHCASTDKEIGSSLDFFRFDDGTTILVRPGFYSFLRFVRSHFDEIYVYTAASRLYARDVVAVIFKGVPLSGIWASEECVIDENNNYKVLTNKFSPGGSCVDSHRTIILDDRTDVSHKNIYARNVPGRQQNHIIVPRFEGDPSDNVLTLLQEQLKKWKGISV